jgi:hypothetical protein
MCHFIAPEGFAVSILWALIKLERDSIGAAWVFAMNDGMPPARHSFVSSKRKDK